MSNILLLRAPSAQEKYEPAFSAIGYTALSVPVLETVFVHLDDLVQKIRGGPGKDYAGVVVTSARACEAWKKVVADLLEQEKCRATNAPGWSTVPFYAVGKATSSALKEIHDLYGRESLHAPEDMRGDSSGTSEQLARFIVEDIEQPSTKRLLYLIGDKTRDVLPNILREAGFELNTLQVYNTQGSSHFAKDLASQLSTAKTPANPWWIVFFAPSAAEFVLPHLYRHFNFSTTSSQVSSELPTARVAAIGPTTALFLRHSIGLDVDVVPPEPTPEALADVIVNHKA